MKKILEDERLSKLNHSCAHLMAQAIKHLYPNAMFWVGPVIEEGFYYDVDLGDAVINSSDLLKIESEMKEAAKKLDFERAMELRDVLFELKAKLEE